ncbi:MAG: 4Fe-4S binding protein [Nitrospiraceae bacterium]|nr:4Fe-4S binding protein [Nitrospiraceae bacterium]
MDEKKELKVTDLKVEDIKTSAQAKGCQVQKALYYISGFLDGPMCGRCFPCALGSFEAKRRLENLAEGRGSEADIDALRRITGHMLEASMCKKGKDTARFIIDWMETDAYRAHVEGRCPEKECIALTRYVVIPDKCTNCNACKEACKHGAIFGEKRKAYLTGYLPFEIRQKRCVKCGDCLRACPEGAIEIVDIAVSETAKV